MSDSKIGIHFGTTYDGKGTRNLKNGIDSAHSAVTRLKDSIKNMGSSIGSSLKAVGSNLMNIKAGFDMLIGVAKKVGEVIKNAFDMSRLENNFKFLIGSTDEARRHMEMLYELGRTPPFSTKEFASASKTMMILTNNVLGGRESLEMLGDAADAVGVPIETMAENVSLFYEMLRDGEPISRVAKSLVRMGAITPEVAATMKQMQEEGKPLNEIWTTLTNSLSKFNGSMENTAKSAGGKVQEFVGHWEEAKTKIGISIAEIADKHIVHLIDKMQELNKHNGFKEWAEDSIGWLGKIGSAVGSVLGAIHDGAVDFGDTIGTMIGGFSEGGFSGMWKAGQDRANAQQEQDIADANDRMDENNVEKVEIVGDKTKQTSEKAKTDLNQSEWKRFSDEVTKASKKLNEMGVTSEQAISRINEIQKEADAGAKSGSNTDGLKDMREEVQSLIKGYEDIIKEGEKLSVDQQKIAENNRKAVEAENKANVEAAKKESKGVYNDEMQRREELKNTLLTQIKARLDKIHEQQKKEKFYIDNSNGGHDGNNGFGEGNRPVDENGRFIRPEHQQEAGRQAGRGERNLDSQRVGENRENAMRQQYDDLRRQIEKNVGGVEDLTDRDRERYNQLKRFFAPEEDQLNKAADQIKKEDLTQLGNKLDEIKTALQDSLKIQ